MVKRFAYDNLDRQLIAKAMARLDARMARERAKQAAATQALKRKRAKERRLVARAESKRNSVIFTPRGPKEVTRILPIAGWKVMAARMAGGAWWDMHQLRAVMPEYAKGSVKAWMVQKLLARGLAEKAGNPDFDETVPAGNQWECRYLYRLTDECEKLAMGWREEIGE